MMRFGPAGKKKYGIYVFGLVYLSEERQGEKQEAAPARTYLVGDGSDSLCQAHRRLTKLVVLNVRDQKLVQLLAHLDLASHGDWSAAGIYLDHHKTVRACVSERDGYTYQHLSKYIPAFLEQEGFVLPWPCRAECGFRTMLRGCCCCCLVVHLPLR